MGETWRKTFSVKIRPKMGPKSRLRDVLGHETPGGLDRRPPKIVLYCLEMSIETYVTFSDNTLSDEGSIGRSAKRLTGEVTAC